MQRDASAALIAFDIRNFEFARAFATPAHTLVGGQTGAAALDHDAVSDDKAGVKTDTKLADQLCIVFLVA